MTDPNDSINDELELQPPTKKQRTAINSSGPTSIATREPSTITTAANATHAVSTSASSSQLRRTFSHGNSHRNGSALISRTNSQTRLHTQHQRLRSELEFDLPHTSSSADENATIDDPSTHDSDMQPQAETANQDMHRINHMIDPDTTNGTADDDRLPYVTQLPLTSFMSLSSPIHGHRRLDHQRSEHLSSSPHNESAFHPVQVSPPLMPANARTANLRVLFHETEDPHESDPTLLQLQLQQSNSSHQDEQHQQHSSHGRSNLSASPDSAQPISQSHQFQQPMDFELDSHDASHHHHHSQHQQQQLFNSSHLSLAIPHDDDETTAITLHHDDTANEQGTFFEGLFHINHDPSSNAQLSLIPTPTNGSTTNSGFVFTPLSSPSRPLPSTSRRGAGLSGTNSSSQRFLFPPGLTPRLEKESSGTTQPESGNSLNILASPNRFHDGQTSSFGSLPALPSPGHFSHSLDTPAGGHGSAMGNAAASPASFFNSRVSHASLHLLHSPAVLPPSDTPLHGSAFSFSPIPSTTARTQRTARIRRVAATLLSIPPTPNTSNMANRMNQRPPPLAILASPANTHARFVQSLATGSSSASSNGLDFLASPPHHHPLSSSSSSHSGLQHDIIFENDSHGGGMMMEDMSEEHPTTMDHHHTHSDHQTASSPPPPVATAIIVDSHQEKPPSIALDFSGAPTPFIDPTPMASNPFVVRQAPRSGSGVRQRRETQKPRISTVQSLFKDQGHSNSSTLSSNALMTSQPTPSPLPATTSIPTTTSNSLDTPMAAVTVTSATSSTAPLNLLTSAALVSSIGPNSTQPVPAIPSSAITATSLISAASAASGNNSTSRPSGTIPIPATVPTPAALPLPAMAIDSTNVLAAVATANSATTATATTVGSVGTSQSTSVNTASTTSIVHAALAVSSNQPATPALAQKSNQVFIPQARTVLSSAVETIPAVIPPTTNTTAVAASTVMAAATPTLVANPAPAPTTNPVTMNMNGSNATANAAPAVVPVAAGIVRSTSEPATATIHTNVASMPTTVAIVSSSSSASVQARPIIASHAPIPVNSTPAVSASTAEPTPAAPLSTHSSQPTAASTSSAVLPPPIATVASASPVTVTPAAALLLAPPRQKRAYRKNSHAPAVPPPTSIAPTPSQPDSQEHLVHALSTVMQHFPWLFAPLLKNINPATGAPLNQDNSTGGTSQPSSASPSLPVPPSVPAPPPPVPLLPESSSPDLLRGCIKIANGECQEMVMKGIQFLKEHFPDSGYTSSQHDEMKDTDDSEPMKHEPMEVENWKYQSMRTELLHYYRLTYPQELELLSTRLMQHAVYIHVFGWRSYQRYWIHPPPVARLDRARQECAAHTQTIQAEKLASKLARTERMKSAATQVTTSASQDSHTTNSSQPSTFTSISPLLPPTTAAAAAPSSSLATSTVSEMSVPMSDIPSMNTPIRVIQSLSRGIKRERSTEDTTVSNSNLNDSESSESIHSRSSISIHTRISVA